MRYVLPRRSFLAACTLPVAAAAAGGTTAIAGSRYLATLPEWGLRPGTTDNQSKPLQTLINAASERGGGTIILPYEHEGTSGSYLVNNIQPKSNVTVQGMHGATLQLPPGADTPLFDNRGERNLNRFVIRDLILDGGGQDQPLIRIKRSGTSGYAWDLGGMYDLELRNASIGAEVDWAGQVYFRGGRVQNCKEGLRLTREHLYLRDVTIWGCRTGIFADQLLHTHWDHVVFAHGGRDSTAVRTPSEGGPHIQESRLIHCEVIDYRRGLDVRYLLDTQISGWRFKSIDYEGVLAHFSGMTELSSCRFLNCGLDPSGNYSAVKIANSQAHRGWRIHSNLARAGGAAPTMRHGFDLSELPDVEDAVIGHDNHVRGSRNAGYRVRPNHTKFATQHNIGTFHVK